VAIITFPIVTIVVEMLAHRRKGL